MPMAAAPYHVDHQSAAAEQSPASPNAASHDPIASSDRDDPTRLLVKMLASTTLGMPPPPAAGASVDVPATAGHFPAGVAPDDDEDPTLDLTKALATATLETDAAVANNNAAAGVSESPPVRASPDGTPAAKKKEKPSTSAGSSRAERQERRRTRLRLIRVPTDYLRAGQESRDRRRRRDLVRRCVGRLLSVHDDRATERGISAMMARLTTALESEGGGGGAAAVSAAAPSPEHAGLVDLLQKMALSKKH